MGRSVGLRIAVPGHHVLATLSHEATAGAEADDVRSSWRTTSSPSTATMAVRVLLPATSSEVRPSVPGGGGRQAGDEDDDRGSE